MNLILAVLNTGTSSFNLYCVIKRIIENDTHWIMAVQLFLFLICGILAVMLFNQISEERGN